MSSRRQHPGEQPDPVRSPSASSAVYESAEESVDLESWASGSLGRPRSALSGCYASVDRFPEPSAALQGRGRLPPARLLAIHPPMAWPAAQCDQLPPPARACPLQASRRHATRAWHPQWLPAHRLGPPYLAPR